MDITVRIEVTRMPKIVDYEAKKKLIMEQAIESFLAKGFHNTHMVDITSACGIGRTTIYQYFRNKHEILEFTIAHLFEALREDFRLTLASEADSPLKTIKRLIPAIIEEYHRNRKLVILVDLWLIMIREENPSIELLERHNREIRGVFRDLLVKGMEKGEIRRLPAESMAFTLFALTESFLLQVALHQEEDIRAHISSLQMLLESLESK
jgi:AcrR family transcriptional regulator